MQVSVSSRYRHNYEMYLRKLSEHSVATAFATNVFPVPGGPYNRIPRNKINL